MQILLTFGDTRSAINAEKLLLEHEIPVSVMPLPTQIGVGCGLCLRLDENWRGQSIDLLHTTDVKVLQTYSIQRENQTVRYEALP